jgi:alkylation response protein AidB-like acyl-CoA dehydrogenase
MSSSNSRSARWSATATTPGSSITVAKTRARTGTAAACPAGKWEALLAEAVRRADAAGHYRYAFPAEYGGRDGTNLGMAVIREHLAGKGLGLHCANPRYFDPAPHS